MRDYLTGELLFRLVCLVVLSSVESFNWTAQPTNPTPAIKGQDVSLAWQYSLTTDEQLQSQTQYFLTWKKLNQSTLNYTKIGIKTYLKAVNSFFYNEPRSPHIVIDRNDQATLHIKDVRREDEGTYKIEFALDSDGTVVAEHRVNLTVLERPELDYVSNNQDVCEDSMVTLYCNATGKPAPNINWTRVWENGTDSEQLPVLDGSYFMSNIKGSSNGTYRCTAYNGVGDPVNRTLEVIVRYSASVVRVVKSSDTVIEGDTFSLTCEFSGDPMPNVTWITVSNNEHSYGNVLNFTNITRGDSGDYRCETKNRCGKESRDESINVFYQPENIRLITNTSSRVCTGVVINFTCTAEANPPVHTYLLYENDSVVKSMGISGTWIKSLENPGKFVFRCEANNSIQGIGKSGNTTLTVDVPAAVEKIENKVVKEGDNVRVYCNVTAGIPDPTVMWTKVTSAEHIKGNPLNITNISRAQAGKYRCTANNTCGVDSTVVDIDVQYQPDVVTLETNTTENEDCSDMWVNFTCISSEANPPVYNYLLSDEKNGFSFSKSETWIKKISRGGKSIYNCTAYQLVGNVTSTNNITLTVNVPASVEQVENKTVTEGGNVEEYCNVTAGFPRPTVVWINVKTGEHIWENPLNITNINRNQAGEYRCTANNTCREASTVMNINVQYQPENVRLITNTTKVCTGDVITFTCTAEANPPVHTYLLYENGTVINNMGISGIWVKTVENAGKFVFRCEAYNSFEEFGASNNTVLTVNVPASVEQVENINVPEGKNVEEYCNVTAGFPHPTLMWTNVKKSEHIKENPLNITNINRTQAGEYRCTANNTCGEASTVMNINVQYPPDIVDISVNKTVNESDTVVLNCTAVANPAASITWTRVSDNSPVSFPLNITGKQDEGGYRCTAENNIQHPAMKTTYISVENYHPIETKLDTSVNSVTLNETFNITCRAQANPAAKYRFYKNQTYVFNDTSGKDVAVFPTLVHERVPNVNYSCTPFNKFGDGHTEVISVLVLFAPFVIDGNHTVFVAQKNCPAAISCPVKGNPAPNITWYKGNDPSTKISKVNTKKLPETVCNGGLHTYTCFAENDLGNITATVKVIVENPAPTTSSTPTTKDPGNEATDVSGRMKVKNVLYKEEFTNLSSEDSKNLTTRCKNGFHEVYQSTVFKNIYNDTRVNKFENGSVVVFFTIIFNDKVRIGDAILVLIHASENGTIGDLNVEAESIKLLPPVPTTPVTSSPTATTSATPGDHTKLWIIVGALAGGAVVLVVIVVVAWCVHHKRKCRRKGSKVRCSESEEQAFTPREDNDHGHVNNGYAEAGPRPTAMVDMSQHQGASVAPTYAVVDKSAKKGSMKGKKDEEKKPQTEPPQYSVVDKSKKKKKKKEEEPEATYAQVNMSKKSKKKAKPGEVLYADLGDFHQMQELPNVSTSPKALPPIKKPAPYVETQYADITQFLKGDVTLPDSEKSQGPATDTQPAPVPENQEGQEPDTSAKETSQASNPGGDGGPDHETNF